MNDRIRGWWTKPSLTSTPQSRRSSMKEVTDIQAKAEADAGGVRIVIPLEITVRIGDSGATVSDVRAGSFSPSGPAPLITKPGSSEAAAAAIRQHIHTNPN